MKIKLDTTELPSKTKISALLDGRGDIFALAGNSVAASFMFIKYLDFQIYLIESKSKSK